MKERPQAVQGKTYAFETPCGKLFTVCNDSPEGNLFEVFCILGKAGGCGAATNNSLGRSISIGLRSGADPQSYVKTLMGVECANSGSGRPSCVSCVAKAIAEHEEEKKEGAQ